MIDMDIANFNKENVQFYTETLWDKIKSRQGLGNYDGTPVGTIISYMGTTPPEGYLACDGAIYNVALYPELVKHIRENFGSINFFGGNGTSTFAVPDLRGEFLRGTGTASRNTGSGAGVGLHQEPTRVLNFEIDENHNLKLPYATGKYANADKTYSQTGIEWVYPDNKTGSNATYTGARMSVRPTNTSVLYCIKYQATFSKKDIEYLINTDTLKAYIDGNMCHICFWKYEITRIHFNIPEITEKYNPKHNQLITGVYWSATEKDTIPCYCNVEIGNDFDTLFNFWSSHNEDLIGSTFYGTKSWVIEG